MEDQFFTQPVKKSNVSTLDIKDLFYKYIRFLPLIILSVILALFGAFLYLRYTSPTYQSNGAIIVKKDNSSGGGEFQQMFVLDNSINIQNEIELLKSQPVMTRVVEGLNLNYTYLSKGQISETNNYVDCPFKVETLQISDSSSTFELNIKFATNHSFRINEEQRSISFGQAFKTSSGTFRLARRSAGALAEEYRVIWQPTHLVAGMLGSDVFVAPKGSTGTLLISMEAAHPQLAADFINRMMEEYQVVTREDKNETNLRMLDFIDRRLKGVQRELDSVTYTLLDYKRRNNIINSEAQSSSYFSRIEEADRTLMEQRAQDNVAEMIADYLRDRNNAYSLVPSTLGLNDPTLGTMISAYNVVQLERKSLIDAKVPQSNPKVQQSEDAIERLRINILESIQILRRSIAASIGRAQNLLTNSQSKMSAMPQKEQEMMEIVMQQQNKQAVFNLLMQQREQTAISLAGTISNMKVVEPARPNQQPVKPKPTNIYLLAVIAGLAIPALTIFALELLNDKINNRQELEKLIFTSIVGEVGHSFSKQALVVKPNSRGIVAEQFRIVRSNLQYFLTGVQKPVLLVTSSFSGEGKSFISTNLGAVMSLANKKTIILEFDIRKPKILSHLGMPQRPGLTNYLLGLAKAEELPVAVPDYPNLFVLPCGPVPPNPAELLLEPKLDELFVYLKSAFDVIVIDTAPVGMVSDAKALSRFADSTLYIVRQGYTLKKQVGLIDEMQASGQLPKVSVILNDVKVGSGYGGYYGKAYGAGSGYFDDEVAPKNGMSRWFGWMDVKTWKKKEKIK